MALYNWRKIRFDIRGKSPNEMARALKIFPVSFGATHLLSNDLSKAYFPNPIHVMAIDR